MGNARIIERMKNMKIKRALAIFICCCSLLALFAGCGSPNTSGNETQTNSPEEASNPPAENVPENSNDENGDGQDASDLFSLLSYDAETMPRSAKGVVFVSGSWYDMGYQYASQASDAVKRRTAEGFSGNVGTYGLEVCRAAEQDYIDYYEQHAPELNDLYEGMADAIGVSFEDFMISQISYADGEMMTEADPERSADGDFCSTMAAWGSQTENGTLIVGANWDTLGENSYYDPCVVAYPENGNAFVTGSGFVCNLAVNDKGLVVAGSSGQSAGESDSAMGIPVMQDTFLLAANCGTAEEARDKYIADYRTVYGDNLHVEDINGGHFIVEASAAHYEVRTSGDFGEKDYLIATNDFMTDEMQSSMLPPGSGYDDCRPRYWTEERVLLDAEGNANAVTIAQAIGSTGFYEDGQWTLDNWSLDTGLNSPEAVSPFYQNVLKSIGIPETASLYVMNGCGNTLVSLNPAVSGNYVQLVLGKDMFETASIIRDTANMLIFDGGNAIAHAAQDEDTAVRREALSKAKEALIAGDNYLNLAGCSEDQSVVREYCGKAASSFLAAQDYAQTASGDIYGVFNY